MRRRVNKVAKKRWTVWEEAAASFEDEFGSVE